MSDEPRSAAAPIAPHCPRIDRGRTVEEHLACAYCYGTRADVASGARARFCDFEPGRDPVSFGFPPGLARDGG